MYCTSIPSLIFIEPQRLALSIPTVSGPILPSVKALSSASSSKQYLIENDDQYSNRLNLNALNNSRKSAKCTTLCLGDFYDNLVSGSSMMSHSFSCFKFVYLTVCLHGRVSKVVQVAVIDFGLILVSLMP